MPADTPKTTPVATYRLQLRGGFDLDAAAALVPWLKDLGVSHLYLAPPFHAASGSTHGYDVIDPTAIDPAIGGEAAFLRLSDAAKAAGLGVVVDIVPNHMAFTPENPWLADVLRHGRESRYAPVFDIDWDRIDEGARIHFPVLDATAADLLAADRIALSGTADAPALRVYDRAFPLREGTAPDTLTSETLATLLDAQHWSLGDWRGDPALIVHRRFFNITDLIGVRQEDPEVFALTHRWIIDQVKAGLIQGLRVDHVDGLARPGGYLHRLREAVGDVPVWVEKIVKPGEALPASWPVEGMSGYEFMSPVTRLLTHAPGLAAMREAGADAMPASTHREVREVRGELLAEVFVPERARVTDAAMAALAASPDRREAIADAVARLATIWPVYRSYAADLCALTPPVAEAVTEAVTEALGDAAEEPDVRALLGLLRAPDDPPGRAFAARFEQLTGALTAKSEEDTVFFRSVAYLPFCEVGSEPDLDAMDIAAFAKAMSARAAKTPLALNALSTHDTKRSADARAVLAALTHFPDLAGELYVDARDAALTSGVPEHWAIYAMQTALMLRGQPEADARIGAHIAKAMREGKDLSRHEAPDEDAEGAVIALARQFLHGLADGTLLCAADAARLDRASEAVILAQVALQLSAPGVPDIYQGTETLAVALTDPDNRRAVDWDAIRSGWASGTCPKLALTRDLLARRTAAPDLFACGSYALMREGDRLVVEREWKGQSFRLEIALAGASVETAR